MLAIQRPNTDEPKRKFWKTWLYPKSDNANETEIILQTQLTRTFATKRQANFESLHNRPRTKTEATKQSQSKPKLTETQDKNLEANFSDSTTRTWNYADEMKADKTKSRELENLLTKNRLNSDLKKYHR